MIPTRAVLTLPALLLVLTGCGAVSAITLRTTVMSTGDRGWNTRTAATCIDVPVASHTRSARSLELARSTRPSPLT